MNAPTSQDSARLLEVLARMIELLRAHDIGEWADVLSDIGARQADQDVRGNIRRLYRGGMGSFNDIVFSCTDRARMVADNDEFAALTSELRKFGG